MDKSTIKLFETKKIRTAWHRKEEERHFSVADVNEILTDSSKLRKYFNVLKNNTK
jgi:hypothetical protein